MTKLKVLYKDNEGYETAKYIVEVHGVGDPVGSYVSNSLRFSTIEDAEAYAIDLDSRWFGMDDWRITDISKENKKHESEL